MVIILKKVIKRILNKYPFFKKVILQLYQRGMYLKHKENIKVEGNVFKISPSDNEHEYFFGYYDKSPWDSSNRYVLCLRVKKNYKQADAAETAEIIVIDTQKDYEDLSRVRVVATTRSWNLQQGCMLQWLGSDFSSRILYNDFRDNHNCSVILNLITGEEQVIDMPVYSVSSDGTFALTLDFNRLHNLRPGYGYANTIETTKDEKLPDSTAIWYVDLVNNRVSSLLTYKDFAQFEPRDEMIGENVIHKVNHIMLSPDNKRFMVLYRWFKDGKKYTRLMTSDITGENLYLLSDDDMVSHCYWRDSAHILAFERKRQEGDGYYLMEDRTKNYTQFWPSMKNDGHPSYSPNNKFVVTDTYPGPSRMSSVKIMRANQTDSEICVVGRFFNPFKYQEEFRCDLHPRWDRTGNIISVDSVYEGKRGLYGIDVRETVKHLNKESIK